MLPNEPSAAVGANNVSRARMFSRSLYRSIPSSSPKLAGEDVRRRERFRGSADCPERCQQMIRPPDLAQGLIIHFSQARKEASLFTASTCD